MGQALAMVTFTSLTVAGTKQSYRMTAIVAFITCFIGAVIFFTYNEKMILGKISELKEKE